MFSYILQKIRKMTPVIEDFYIDKTKLDYDYTEASQFGFDKPIKMHDSEFWKFCRVLCNDLEMFLHKKTNIILARNGRLIGRYVGDKIIPLEGLDNKEHIIYWYAMCQ